MLSFSKFIVEAGDVALPFKDEGEVHSDDGSKYHSYTFDHNDKKYRVNIVPHSRSMSVYFGNSVDDRIANTSLTGDQKNTAIRILSTVHNIVKHHVSKHPDVEKVRFTSDNLEPSRVKLYTKYTEKHGGITGTTPDDTVHIIPAKAYRSVNESEDETIRIKLGQKPSGKRADAFLDEYKQDSDEHPFHRSARILHGSIVDLSKDGNNIHIHDIVSTAPKTGVGTKALKHLTRLADKHGIKLNLFAKAYSNRPEHIRSTPKLIKWYEKHDFKHDEPDYDPDYGSEMTYYPKL